MAKKTSLFEDLFHIASKLPWWLSALIAISSGLYLHSVATAPMPVYSDPQHLQSVVFGTFWRTFAMFGQYLLPFIFTAGAVASIIGRRKRRNLLKSAAASKGNPLLSITWHEFELLVGEALRRRGYSVRETGKNGPDGGIDLIARKDGETYVVQCKQWRSMQVGLPVVRQLYGAMAAEGAVGGFVVTSGTFTKPARDFAAGRNVQLVDGTVLKPSGSVLGRDKAAATPGWVMRWHCVSDELGAEAIFAGKRAPTVDRCLAGTKRLLRLAGL